MRYARAEVINGELWVREENKYAPWTYVCHVGDMAKSFKTKGRKSVPLTVAIENFIEAMIRGKLQQCIHGEWVNVDVEQIPVGYMVRARKFRIISS